MSQFGPQVLPVEELIAIPGADKIELAQILGYQAVVQKGAYAVGTELLYIPEGFVVPEKILQHIGLVGMLAGSQKNRVKARKMLGQLSQGITCPVSRLEPNIIVEVEGERVETTAYLIQFQGDDNPTIFWNGNVGEILGIQKYEPPVPGSLSGAARVIRVPPAGGTNVGSELTVKYDIENIKSYKNVLQDGEEVVITEKLHGTCFCVAHVPGLDQPDLFFDGNTFCYSKGLGARGIVFFDNERNRASNTYVKMMLEHEEKIRELFADTEVMPGGPIYIFGEIFGVGVQDLGYGEQKPAWRIFDVHFGYRNQGAWGNWDDVEGIARNLNVPTVPVLYRGPWSQSIHEEYRDGLTTLNGGANIREGIVIKPAQERSVRGLGRVILKSVSPAYLLRKGGTEHN
jgi:RNA ligase (TIGR02306 family)